MNRALVLFGVLFVGVLAFGQEAVLAVASTVGVSAGTLTSEPVVVSSAMHEVPAWLDKVLSILSGLPVVGPVVVEILKYLGVFAVVITSFTAFLMASVRALVAVFNVAKLVELAAKLKAFEDSKVMYYLKYFSLFNASKKVEAKKSA